MVWIFFKVAIDGAALIANRYGFQNPVENDVDRCGDEQANKIGVITKQHAECKYKNAEAGIKILLQIKTLAAAHRTSVNTARAPQTF